MNTYTAIDIGSENIKIISMREGARDKSLSVVSKTSYPSEGLKYGYITDPAAFTISLRKAVTAYSKENRIILDESFFSLSGFGLSSEVISIEHQVTGNVISEFDIEKIEKKAMLKLKKKTKDRVIEKKITKYLIDGFEHFGSPVGLSAKKFSVNFLFITYPENSLTILEESISKSGISAISFIPALLCSATTTISDLDKKLGCALVDIGAETTSIIIYENNAAIHYHVLKNGSKKITEKISLSEKIDFFKADKLKKVKINSKKVNKITSDYLKDIAKKVSLEINSAGKGGLLPGGITLVGGGSRISNIEEIFKKEILLPVKKSPRTISDSKTDYHVCYGNIIMGIKEEKTSNNISMPDLLAPLKVFLKKFTI